MHNVSYFGPGTVRSLGLVSGRTRAISLSRLTPAILRAHGAYIVACPIRSRVAVYVGDRVTAGQFSRVADSSVDGMPNPISAAPEEATTAPAEKAVLDATKTAAKKSAEAAAPSGDEAPAASETVVETPTAPTVDDTDIAALFSDETEVPSADAKKEESIMKTAYSAPKEGLTAEDPPADEDSDQVGDPFEGISRKELVLLLPEDVKPKRSRADVVAQLIELGLAD